MPRQSDDGDPLKRVNFVCKGCRRFQVEPDRVEDAPEETFHPYHYFANCPECGIEARQAQWERNLMRAWPNATGPKSLEGKATATANLAGHPTPEEAQRTRFNAMKHGLFARTATFYPAKPGRYPQCEGCEYLVPRTCVTQGACLKRSELFLRFHIAFQQRDPKLLMQLWADNQAGLQALIMDMVTCIAADGGPQLVSPEWYYDKDGRLHWVESTNEATGEKTALMKHEAHPLLKPLIDFIHKSGINMPELVMTPKSQDEEQLLRGYLDRKGDQAESEEDFRRRMDAGQQKLLSLLGGKDPHVLDGEAKQVVDSA